MYPALWLSVPPQCDDHDCFPYSLVTFIFSVQTSLPIVFLFLHAQTKYFVTHPLPWAITHVCFLPSLHKRAFIKLSSTESERSKPTVFSQVCDDQQIKDLPDKICNFLADTQGMETARKFYRVWINPHHHCRQKAQRTVSSGIHFGTIQDPFYVSWITVTHIYKNTLGSLFFLFFPK